MSGRYALTDRDTGAAFGRLATERLAPGLVARAAVVGEPRKPGEVERLSRFRSRGLLVSVFSDWTLVRPATSLITAHADAAVEDQAAAEAAAAAVAAGKMADEPLVGAASLRRPGGAAVLLQTLPAKRCGESLELEAVVATLGRKTAEVPPTAGLEPFGRPIGDTERLPPPGGASLVPLGIEPWRMRTAGTAAEDLVGTKQALDNVPLVSLVFTKGEPPGRTEPEAADARTAMRVPSPCGARPLPTGTVAELTGDWAAGTATDESCDGGPARLMAKALPTPECRRVASSA